MSVANIFGDARCGSARRRQEPFRGGDPEVDEVLSRRRRVSFPVCGPKRALRQPRKRRHIGEPSNAVKARLGLLPCKSDPRGWCHGRRRGEERVEDRRDQADPDGIVRLIVRVSLRELDHRLQCIGGLRRCDDERTLLEASRLMVEMRDRRACADGTGRASEPGAGRDQDARWRREVDPRAACFRRDVYGSPMHPE